VIKEGKAWEQEIDSMKQRISDEKDANRLHSESNKEKSQEDLSSHGENVANGVKVVDKSYLDKNFHISGHSELVDSTVMEFSLNKKQEHTFRIIANHAVMDKPEQCIWLEWAAQEKLRY
jgi:hypothetical protein